MLIEGFLIKLKDGSYWVVKGCLQPKNHVVAIPRYIGKSKIKKLSNAFNFVKQKYSQFIKYVNCLGREVPVIPYNFIEEIYNPLSYKKYIKNRISTARIYAKALELAKIFKHFFNHDVGVTGSLIIGNVSETSDIDLILYGVSKKKSHEIAERLSEMFKQGLLKHLGEELFLEELNEVKEVIDAKDHIKITKQRLLQGVYDRYKYTLRLVKCKKVEECKGFVKTVGYIDIHGIITDDTGAFLTPTEYHVKVIKATPSRLISESIPTKLFSLRIRFTELGKGTTFKARVLLQKTNNEYILNLDSINAYFKIISYRRPNVGNHLIL